MSQNKNSIFVCLKYLFNSLILIGKLGYSYLDNKKKQDETLQSLYYQFKTVRVRTKYI